MSKGDKEGFIVKFVESKGQKTEHAVKAYQVISYYACLNLSLVAPLPFSAANDYVCYTFQQAILELQSEKYLKTVDEDAVLQMDQKDKSLFVFSSFTTPAFLHCKKV